MRSFQAAFRLPFLALAHTGLLFAQGQVSVETADLQAHYARVEAELRVAPPPADPLLAASRAATIDLLHAYWQRGDFGRNLDHPGQRQPHFVDRDGRRCAVAYLLDRTGQRSLVLEIAAARNHAWVAELLDDARLQRWLQEHGLSAAEAARIQAPPRMPMLPEPPPMASPSESFAPGDAAAVPQVAQAASASSGTPSAARPGVAAPGMASAAVGVPLDAMGAPAWVEWWDWNRLGLLPPRRLAAPALDDLTVARAAGDVAARALLRLGLSAADARERAAAALALGRLGGEATRLRELLDDSDLQVQVAAILGLGSDGGAQARHVLVSLASGRAVTRPYALLAMAGLRDLARAPEVVGLAKAALRGDEPGAAAAAVLARVLADDELRQQALAMESRESVVGRARLVETLAQRDDGKLLGRLTTALSSRSPDVRRSAALALARTRHALALPALMTAFELEHELATKQVLLLAIGSHGGKPGVAFVEEQLQRGVKPVRAFAALALGSLVREQAVPGAVQALRQAAANEHNHDHLGAHLLALGLARDQGALPLLRAKLQEGADAYQRAMAADAMALLAATTELPRLHRALVGDSCPFVRSAAAAAIGVLGGDDADAAALAGAASADPDRSVRTAAAQALGALGSEAARRELLQLARSGDVMTRAGALSGLGRLLRAREPMVSPGLTAVANSSLWPDWLRWAMAQEF
ncbi:MAG: HEAT repeat domain-containing protein [Planctomycetes bacterium]|nr:HEAT repeat domain-containing protein [Planctomycetota bacterium]